MEITIYELFEIMKIKFKSLIWLCIHSSFISTNVLDQVCVENCSRKRKRYEKIGYEKYFLVSHSFLHLIMTSPAFQQRVFLWLLFVKRITMFFFLMKYFLTRKHYNIFGVISSFSLQFYLSHQSWKPAKSQKYKNQFSHRFGKINCDLFKSGIEFFYMRLIKIAKTNLLLTLVVVR